LRYGGFTFQGMFSQREKGTPTAYFGTVFNDPRTRNFDDHQYFDLSYQHGIGERWQLEARTSYDQYRLVAPLAMAAPTPGGPTGVDKYSDRGNWWTGELRLSTTLWHKHRLTFGTEIRDNLRQDQGLFLSASSTFEQDLTSSWNWATYAQDEYEITRKLSLSVGVRHDGYPQGTVIDMLTGQPAVTTPLPSFGGATNPRVGLIYHPYQKTTLKFLYGSAFRAPKVFETTPDIGGFVVDNLALKPETIKSLEAVAEQELGQRFTLWGSVFQSRIRNLITLETDPGSGQLAYRNSQKAVATGTEVGLTARWASGLQGAASFSFVDGDDGGPEDQELPNSPRHIAKLNLSVPLIGKRLFAGLEGQYIGARHTVAGNTLGGFQVFNVTLLGHTLGRHLDLSGSLYNILDKRYADPGRPEDPEDSIQQDGRNFRIKITGRF
jgi:iron complex outermembrane receptor protein